MGNSASIELGGRRVGLDDPPYVVGEVSANHGGDFSAALEIIDAIAGSGADAVKLQTYRPDTITLDAPQADFQLDTGPWAGRSLYELYEWAHTPLEWHDELFRRARETGLQVFSSPFDFSAVDFLEGFDPPAYKIASFELVDLPLIEYVASKGRPLIMSTGMASDLEVMEAVLAARRSGCEQLCLLHCTSGYPTPPSEADLRTIPELARKYGTVAGLSDHTLGTAVPVAAVALGARVIEKHVTLRRQDGGPDAAFSLEPDELRTLTSDVHTAWGALGEARDAPRPSEATQRPLRRSLYVPEDLKPGDVLTPETVRSVRPGYGLHTRHYRQVLGRRVVAAVAKGTPLSWKFVE